MAKAGNPNHDPKTGKFTSGSGLNTSNSTRKERAKANFKTAAKAAAAFGGALAIGAAAQIGKAAITGAARSLRREADIGMTSFVKSAAPHVDKAASKAVSSVLLHGKSVAKHAINLKRHIMKQHDNTVKFPKGYSPTS